MTDARPCCAAPGIWQGAQVQGAGNGGGEQQRPTDRVRHDAERRHQDDDGVATAQARREAQAPVALHTPRGQAQEGQAPQSATQGLPKLKQLREAEAEAPAPASKQPPRGDPFNLSPVSTASGRGGGARSKVLGIEVAESSSAPSSASWASRSGRDAKAKRFLVGLRLVVLALPDLCPA